MENSTWLMFRTLQQNSVESRTAYQLLMELSRYAQDNETATRIWNAAQSLMDNAEALSRISEELQSGLVCRRDCLSRVPSLESIGMFGSAGVQHSQAAVPVNLPQER